MTTYYKAVTPDGASFYDPSFRWLPADGVIPDGGWLVKHPHPAKSISGRSGAKASRYLSVSTEPADCTEFLWPCRLLVVEPVGGVAVDDQYPHKRRVRAARVTGEVEAWRAFGPNGKQVVAYLDLLPMLSVAASDAAWVATWVAASDAAWVAASGAASDAARAAARAAAWDAARWAARDAARNSVRALVVRDLISPEHFDVLAAPMRAAGVDFDALGGAR